MRKWRERTQLRLALAIFFAGGLIWGGWVWRVENQAALGQEFPSGSVSLFDLSVSLSDFLAA
jgi:hypothetical protein